MVELELLQRPEGPPMIEVHWGHFAIDVPLLNRDLRTTIVVLNGLGKT